MDELSLESETKVLATTGEFRQAQASAARARAASRRGRRSARRKPSDSRRPPNGPRPAFTWKSPPIPDQTGTGHRRRYARSSEATSRRGARVAVRAPSGRPADPIRSEPVELAMPSTKFVIVIPDGAADEPFEALGGKTAAPGGADPGDGPDRARGESSGRSRNVPDRFLPASDVATLSLLGYDPERYYTGRAPLEAAAMGIELGPDDWAIRCNLMTIRDGRLTDFTAGHITSDEGAALDRGAPGGARPARDRVSPGRQLSQPDDLPRPAGRGAVRRRHGDRPAARPSRPAGRRPPAARAGRGAAPDADDAGDRRCSKDHPVNQARVAAGKPPANAIWLWGQGKAPQRPEVRRAARAEGGDHLGRRPGPGRGRARRLGRGSTSRARPAISTPTTRPRGGTRSQALGRSRHRLRPRRGPRRGQPRGPAPRPRSRPSSGSTATSSGRSAQALEAVTTEWRILISPDHSTLLRTRAHDRALVAWAMAGTGLPASGQPLRRSSPRATAGGPFFEQGYQLMERFLDLGWDGRIAS